ncbi:hypothetical protein [Paenibacillus periandrae]|uniref:hypothetical protein n=1 Tax=Paenibacillus periandrae TaxID=1761741 RepID=UPI001F09E39E|nr:hypothetical protein [Paenibacillus periandrae]
MKGTRSITSTILWRLIPGLIFFVASTGLVSYYLSAEQLKSNAYDNIYDTVSQTKNYLDDRLDVLLAAVVALSNNNSNKDLTQTLHASEEPDYMTGPSDYIALNQAGVFVLNQANEKERMKSFFANGKKNLRKEKNLQ